MLSFQTIKESIDAQQYLHQSNTNSISAQNVRSTLDGTQYVHLARYMKELEVEVDVAEKCK